MTTYNHTAITTGAAANAVTINNPLGELDAAIGALTGLAITKTSVAAAIGTAAMTTAAQTLVGAIDEVDANADTVISEVTTARASYANLDARLDALVLAGGVTSTTLSANASGGNSTITVASITGFANGDRITITLNAGNLHTTTINGAPSGSTITLTAAMPGAGVVASSGNVVCKTIEEVYQAAQAVSHVSGTTMTLVDAMSYASQGVHDVQAHGLVGNASTDDAPALAALVAAKTGGVIYFSGPDKIYKLNSAVTVGETFVIAVAPDSSIWITESAKTNITFACPQPCNVRWFGATSGGAGMANVGGDNGFRATMTNTSNQITNMSEVDVNLFRVGQGVYVYNVGVTKTLVGTITARTLNGATSSITLSDTATQTDAAVRVIGDDSRAINAVLESWVTTNVLTGRMIYFPQDSYEVEENPIIIKQGPVALVGDHYDNTTIYSSRQDCINIGDGATYSGSVIDIRHLHLATDGSSKAGIRCLTADTIIDSLISHCWFSGNTATQIGIYGVTQTTAISNCVFDNLNHGIYLETNGTNAPAYVNISNILFANTKGIAIYLNGATNHPCRHININNVTYGLQTADAAAGRVILASTVDDLNIGNLTAYNSGTATTTLTAQASAGASALTVADESGFSAGSIISYPLSTGVWEWNQVVSTAANTLNLENVTGGIIANGTTVNLLTFLLKGIDIQGCNRVNLSNVTLRDIVGTDTTNGAMVWLQANNQISAQNINLEGTVGTNDKGSRCPTYGFVIWVCDQVFVDGFRIRGTRREGIKGITTASNDVHFSNGLLSLTGIAAAATYAALLPYTGSWLFHNVAFKRSGSGSNMAIDLTNVANGNYFEAVGCSFDTYTTNVGNPVANPTGRTAIRETRLGGGIITLSGATPSVIRGVSTFAYSDAGVTITNLLYGYPGQRLTIIFSSAATVDFTGTNLKGNNGADFVAAIGDHMTCICADGTTWYCHVADNTP